MGALRNSDNGYISSQLENLTKQSKFYQGTSNHYFYSGQAVNSNNNTSKSLHNIDVDCESIECVFGNFRVGDNANDNSITIKCALEIEGVIYPLFFGESRSITIEAGSIAVTSEFRKPFSAGDTFFIRTNVTQPVSGGKQPRGNACLGSSGEGYGEGDLVDSGTINPAYVYGYYYPIAILSTNNPYKKSGIIVGDSIAQGAFDAIGGYIARGLVDRIGSINLSRAGETATQFNQIAYSWIRNKFIRNATHAYVNYGTNETESSVATVKAGLQALWDTLDKNGIKVYQATITPRTTSEDSWATVENQTVVSEAREAVRLEINEWIRTVPSPLSGIMEVADIVESGRDSGFWKVNYTSDGVHFADPTTTQIVTDGIEWDVITS